MRVCSHQPTFLPWVGWFNKVLHSDILVVPVGLPIMGAGDRLVFRTMVDGSWATMQRRNTEDNTFMAARVWPTSVLAVKKRLAQTYMSKRMPYRDRIDLLLGSKSWDSENATDICLGLAADVLTLLGRTVNVACVPFRGVEDTKTKRLFERINDAVSPPYEYLMGRGATEYMQPDEAPAGVELMVQEFTRKLYGETILVVLAHEPDPLDYIMTSAKFVPWVPRENIA